MTTFTIANLGDAAFSLATGTVNGTSTISSPGVTFVNNTSAGVITLTLDDDLGLLLIKDVAGNANTYPITVSATAIDGATSTTLSVAYQWIWLQWNGSGYSLVG